MDKIIKMHIEVNFTSFNNLIGEERGTWNRNGDSIHN